MCFRTGPYLVVCMAAGGHVPQGASVVPLRRLPVLGLADHVHLLISAVPSALDASKKGRDEINGNTHAHLLVSPRYMRLR
jgi:hypothetical protein